MSINFYDDYSEGAHSQILEYILENNIDSQLGYCNDDYCALAADRIRTFFGLESEAAVHFLPNGTISNIVGLSSMLKPFEGVISTSAGHINTHEAGALEAAGHKIIYVQSENGKLTPELIETAYLNYEDEHTVVPRVVYISQSTELGTVYSLPEIKDIVEASKAKDMFTFLDGARLAMALNPVDGKVDPKEFGSLGLDMFYIGGTKNGGVFGEAVVINNPLFQKYFRNHMKQRGALMAKGRFMGQQFAKFFEVDESGQTLWMKLGLVANKKADLLYRGLKASGAHFLDVPKANQLFPILDNELIEQLEQHFGFYRWQKIDANKTQIRLTCSWATTDQYVELFLSKFNELS